MISSGQLGRWINSEKMMKKLISATLACLLAATVFAEEVNRTVDAASDGHVNVSNIAGAVTVNGWTRKEVEVTGTLGRNVEDSFARIGVGT